MVQKRRGDQKAFAELAVSMMSMVLHEQTASVLTWYFDGYRNNLIKNPKRERERSDAQKAIINSEPSRQTTRYI